MYRPRLNEEVKNRDSQGKTHGFDNFAFAVGRNSDDSCHKINLDFIPKLHDRAVLKIVERDLVNCFVLQVVEPKLETSGRVLPPRIFLDPTSSQTKADPLGKAETDVPVVVFQNHGPERKILP